MLSFLGLEIDFLQNIGEILFKLILALILGGLIGFEREFSGKAAGLRTNILICVGAATFTIVSLIFGGETETTDVSRVAAQIVTGIGFLGAGTIIQARGEVRGLTSAATIWVVAAIGLSLGAGYYSLAFVCTAVVMVALMILGRIEKGVSGKQETLRYEITLENSPGAIEKVQHVLRKSQVDLFVTDITKEGEAACLAVRVSASQAAHEGLTKTLTPLPEVRKIHFA